LDQLSASYEADEAVKEIITKLVLDSAVVPHFTWVQGLLCYKNRIWVGAAAELKLKLISAFHDSAVSGHSRAPMTYRRLKQHFAWKGMKAVVIEFVQACVTCQIAKPERVKYRGLLQPLHVPKWGLADYLYGIYRMTTHFKFI
jgi:hypothetical protein